MRVEEIRWGAGADPETNGTEIQAALDFDDILCLSNCVNETIGYVDDVEFHARVGVSKDFARRLQGDLGEMIRGMYR